jgi:hypothetical protein
MFLRSLAAAAFAVSLCPAAPGAGPPKTWAPRVGWAVPAQTIRTLEGREIAISKLRGKAVWIAFFHSA